jgi:glutamate synthase domain-containing protein 2
VAAFWILLGLLTVVAVYDVSQRRHAILRNFPVIGHLRYLLEAFGPELRQYIVTNNNEERPFSRTQRRWIYASSKRQNNYFAFGSDNEPEASSNYLIVKHSAFPKSTPHVGEPGYDSMHPIPAAIEIGAWRGRKRPFRPGSVVNVSGMSYGSLSGAAVEALNKGAKLAGCFQNTGEGGLSPYHLQGGDLMLQVGTGYFGCRELDGRFSLPRLKDLVAAHPQIRAIEIKLSQGAKPGAGGVLPKEKITAEIAAIRHIDPTRDCVSPASHAVFHDADSLLDFVERVAQETGLPVGVKSAVGDMGFWNDIARLCATTGRSVDFVTIDGGEGGTGAAPLVFVDHVGLPFKIGFSRVHRTFAEQGLTRKVAFIGSGKLGLPDTALMAFVLGADMVNIAREALMAIGCIQAQRCHTNHCPTGIATQSAWLARGLDPTLKSARLANYIVTLRKDLVALTHACGKDHPTEVTADQIEILDDRFGARTLREAFGVQDAGTGATGTGRRAA